MIIGLSDDCDGDDNDGGANEPLIRELDLDGVTSQVPADLLEPSQSDEQRDSPEAATEPSPDVTTRSSHEAVTPTQSGEGEV